MATSKQHTTGAAGEAEASHQRPQDRPGTPQARSGIKAARMIRESPSFASDLLEAPRETLLAEAIQARKVAAGATSALARAVVEIERLEHLLGLDQDDDE